MNKTKQNRKSINAFDPSIATHMYYKGAYTPCEPGRQLRPVHTTPSAREMEGYKNAADFHKYCFTALVRVRTVYRESSISFQFQFYDA